MPEQDPFQAEGTAFHIKHPRSMNGDAMGLGKTNQILMARKHVNPDTSMTVCSKSAQYTWIRESGLWIPDMEQPIVVAGSKEERQELWHAPHVISTYKTLLMDIDYVEEVKGKHVDMIMCDEAHKIRNRKAQQRGAIKLLNSDYLYQMSGSFVARGAQDLWAHLNLCNEKLFSSYWKYVNTFCWTDRSGFGTDIIANKNVAQLRELLKDYLILRTKEQVAAHIPPKRRQRVDIPLLPLEQKLYNELSSDLIVDLDQYTGADEQKFIIQSSQLGSIIKLRQLLVSPQILDPRLPVGSAIDTIIDWLMDQDIQNRHVLIFCPFKDGLDILQRELERVKLGHPVLRLQGGCGPKEIGYAEETFRKGEGVLISTTQFAESWSAETAYCVWMLGCEYDPEMNKQAEDRAHRFTTKHSIMCYYTNHLNTFEDRVFEILNDKNRSSSEITHFLRSAPGLKSIIQG